MQHAISGIHWGTLQRDGSCGKVASQRLPCSDGCRSGMHRPKIRGRTERIKALPLQQLLCNWVLPITLAVFQNVQKRQKKERFFPKKAGKQPHKNEKMQKKSHRPAALAQRVMPAGLCVLTGKNPQSKQPGRAETGLWQGRFSHGCAGEKAGQVLATSRKTSEERPITMT